MMDLSLFARNLVRDSEGIWRAPGPKAEVSYPGGGHSRCFAVEESSFWFEHRNRVLIRLLREFPPGGPLFDIGGGNGHVCAALGQAGFPAVLVEPSEEGVHNALSRGLDPVVRSSFEEADFRDRTLPAVGLFDVLEHIRDDGETLRRVEKALVPDGRLYLTVPAFPVLWSASDVHAGHHRRYRLNQIGDRFRQAGLTVEFRSYLFSPLWLPVLLLRSVPARLGFPLRPGSRRTRRDHLSQHRGMGSLLGAILRVEQRRIGRGKRIPLGSSCLVVGRAATRKSA